MGDVNRKKVPAEFTFFICGSRVSAQAGKHVLRVFYCVKYR